MNTLIKDIYQFELNRKDQISARLPLGITILTLLGSIAAFLTKHTYTSTHPHRWLAVIFATAIIVTLAVAAFNLYCCILGRTYKALALGSDFLRWQDDVREYYGVNNDNSAQEYIKRHLDQRMVEAIDVNASINDMRSAYFNNACIDFGLAAVLEVICGTILALLYI